MICVTNGLYNIKVWKDVSTREESSISWIIEPQRFVFSASSFLLPQRTPYS